jgi:ABC-type transport system substrate-binding protein
MEKYKEMQQIMLADVPVVFLYFSNYIYVLSRDIKGFSGTALIEPSNRFSDVSDWYIKTKKIFSW